MKLHILNKQTLINKPLEEVFSFFSKPGNLNLITPPELGFEILTELPFEMKKGAVIDYVIKLKGIPLKWKTEITKWEPPFLFEDTQLKGPYKIWIHEHSFKETKSGTIMTDIVKYRSPGWIFEFILHNLFVKKNVSSIFNYREKVLNEIFS